MTDSSLVASSEPRLNRRQAAKIRISIDTIERLPELICDGVLVATPAGRAGASGSRSSTAATRGR